MKKVFIDAGCHKGESIDAFMKSKYYDSSFEIHAFEPESTLYNELIDHPHIDYLHTIAVYTHNGYIDFYDTTGTNKSGNSICSSKTTANLDKRHPKKVSCIDFSQWMEDTFDRGDLIYVRMNIEGAEYPVLTKMLMDGTIRYINKLSIRFHWEKINYPQSMHEALVSELNKNVKMNITRLRELY